MKHKALVTIIDYSGKGPAWLAKAVKGVSVFASVHKISSIYQDSVDVEAEISESPLVTCVLCESEFARFEFIDKIIEVEADINSQATREVMKLLVLSQDDFIIMTPKLALPYPKLFTHPQLLFPASEIWPEYEHPVIKKTLLEMTKGFEGHRWGSYFAQGSSLLDFSDSKK